ncbi:DUF2569 domain-containing protein [Chimaeribacter coloradensis]|uniref:DUF2569 domain-containing protein n=1 Tax=Chimaeribacter coloradensis TaxID=2060068 RepID=A0A2N5E149_9GAMM|nr:DUF2569 domain-containing protein [Chimaeribacter coloradensis]PLR34045.1 DUF2569 domain-containing protein [Chimaeribacter coloradensis]
MSLNQDARRIGGWLLAPLAYLIMTLLGNTLTLVLYGMALSHSDSRARLLGTTGMALPWYLSLVTALAMWLFSAWVLWQFTQRKRIVPRLYIFWLLVTVLLAIKSFAFAPVPDDFAVRSLLAPLLAAALLVPYFARSRRVKQTFIG